MEKLPLKKTPYEVLKNGASDGINFEPYCVKFLHLCLHDEDTIEQIKLFLYNKDIKDY